MELAIGLFLSMLCSAFFSGMEIAFVSADKLRLEVENEKHGVTAQILSFFYRRKNHFISTMLVGNNISLVIYGVFMAQIIGQYWLSEMIESELLILMLQTVLSTLLILVVGEFLPKTIFKLHATSLLSFFAIPVFICYILLYPISKITSGIGSVLLRLTGLTLNKDIEEKAFSKVDLDYFIQSSIDNISNKEELKPEVEIFRNALDFSQTKIRDCMVPRTEIVAVPYDATAETLKTRFVESGLSKLIVYKEGIDNILGYIHSSEMFRHPDDWQKYIQKMPFVPDTMGANKMLHSFMQGKKTLAVVIDEFGGTSGIVSLEDLVEEIFGDIQDEHDTLQYVAKQVGENEYVLSARLEIEKVNEMFGLNLPESDDYITVGGLILQHYQNFPKLHEVISIGPFQFKIIKVTATKIELVRLNVNQ